MSTTEAQNFLKLKHLSLIFFLFKKKLSWERIKLFEQNLFLEEGIEAWDSYSEKRLNSFLFLIFLQCGYCEPHFLINIFFKKSIISFPFNQWLVFYLKSPIFIVQRAYIPKNGVEFRQQSNGDNRSGVATSYNLMRRRQKYLQSNDGAKNEVAFR